MNLPDTLEITGLLTAYRSGALTPAQLIDTLLGKAANSTAYNIWTRPLTRAELQPYLDRLQGHTVDELPLYGIPFAIKDNIDLAGIPTTAGCPDFAYTPGRSAFVVQRLLDAGAIPLGKTNLDQFATGLVGVRSPEPYGVCRNAFDADYISGGSSSGSAVALARGLVSFSLGTDTAGSGRVPAAFNNLVGVKPSKGLLSTTGLVPACRTLDCISIFAVNTADATRVLDVAAVYDAEDCYARDARPYASTCKASFSFAVPRAEQLQFFANDDYRTLFVAAVERLVGAGGVVTEIDFAPFMECARLLYEGPWVAERYAAIQELVESHPEALHPTIRDIIEPARELTAVAAFAAEYRRANLQRQCDAVVAEYDFVLTPTAGTIYRIDEVLADPIQLNSNLGYYTNFMNLLDLAALAVPGGFTSAGLPFGITLFGPALSDAMLLDYARLLQAGVESTLPEPAWSGPSRQIRIAVCGAHLSGMPLNGQLTTLGAYLEQATTTAPVYKLYALTGGPPHRPGLVRQQQGAGSAIEVEVWQLPAPRLADFMRQIPSPLGIGSIQLVSGDWVPGFICEPCALDGAEDISALGSWRNYHPQS